MPADDAPPDDEKRGWSDPDPETWNRRITQGSVPVAQQTMSADADRQPGDNAEADADEAAAPGAAEVPPLGADRNGAAANPADPQPADPQPADNGPPNKRNRRRAPSLPATWPFVWKDLQFGRVVALASDDPFAYPAAEWRWLVNTITPARWKWRFRHGLSLDLDNPSFDNFLIADVGLPPVRAYRVLISLFVILIGPVNYWYLRRHGRLHLLLFTVPAAALVATLALVGYAFIADGLESRCAARSLTFLDQRHHEATSWARLSYYTGLTPASGLVFPTDTAVFSLEKFPRGTSPTAAACGNWPGTTSSNVSRAAGSPRARRRSI